MVVTAVDPAGQRWEVARRWYLLRRDVPYDGPRYDTPSDRSERVADGAMFALALPEVLMQLVVLPLLLAGALVGAPAICIALVTGAPVRAALVLTIMAYVVVAVFHPLLRVPFRRPWRIEARRADGDERPSAWDVVGWNNSRRAVTVVVDALTAGEDLSQLTPFALESRARALPVH